MRQQQVFTLAVLAAVEPSAAPGPHGRPASLNWQRALPENASRLPEVAACVTGQLRFADLTASSILYALQPLDVDLFAYAVGGRGSDGQRWLRVDATAALNFTAAVGPAWRETAQGRAEWRAAQPVLQRAVAGRIDHRDNVTEELHKAGSRWESQVRFPGPWLGGLEEQHGSARLTRVGSGLYLTYMQNWCRDNILEREKLRRRKYRWLIHMRWDQEFVVPFPPVEILDEFGSASAWSPGFVAAHFGTYDRFGIYPRHAMESYLGGWNLIVSGRAEKVLNDFQPASGEPLLLPPNDATTPERYLQLRLRHGKILEARLPMLAFIRCKGDGSDGTLHSKKVMRSRGWWGCTSLRGVLGHLPEIESSEMPWMLRMGGTKYALELVAAASTWACWASHDAQWTSQSFRACSRTAHTVEQDAMFTKRLCFGAEAAWSSQCMELAERYGKDLPVEAVEVMKAAARSRPLCIDHWIRLALMLLKQPVRNLEAAKAALTQALALNAHHAALAPLAAQLSNVTPISLLELTQGSFNVPPIPPLDHRGSGLDHVLHRRVLQQRLKEETSTEAGRNAWLQWAQYMVRIWWVGAAACAVEHLEASVPAAVSPRPWLQTKAAIVDLLENPPRSIVAADVAGITYARLLSWAPSPREMLSTSWLERMEARGRYFDRIGLWPASATVPAWRAGEPL